MIEIVTHCYNYSALGADQYSQLLKWQLASLANHSPKCDFWITICCSRDDEELHKMLSTFWRHASVAAQRIALLYLPYEKLFRRAIGRNIRAKHTKANVVWFTDCDYCFGEGCLDAVAELVTADSGLCIPKTCKISYDVNGVLQDCERPNHETGHAAIERERDNPLPELREDEFMEREEKRAIGGLQIIGGNLARKIGYLDGTRWVEPVDPQLGFRSCRCDAAWRRANGLKAMRLPIPNCYRLRHLIDGRDYDLAGTKQGKEIW